MTATLEFMSDKKGKRKPGRPPLGATAKPRNTDRHASPRESFHLPPELHQTLIEFVEGTDPRVDKSAVMRSALEEYFRKRGKWPRP